ncbi:flagellar basal body-associated protein FliL [Chryseobacterium ginsenosidimutans]|uniref:DUF3592 domain-containing protein n=1 Tax=Chryseobacterium ginsenosidimutans TaxID=687846 RepID=UPI002168EB77|nr:hypothetical protein [Chryseobacterium ginsenosidimutans]MCS3868113.1 flagellar basal body-associated protein FliL [Chryseobacterium ginsenosidimutans]
MEETRKEKIKGNIIVLVMMGLYLGITGYFGYLTGSGTGTKAKYKKECETFKKTTADIEYTYDQTTLSKGSVKVDINKFHYTYVVNNQYFNADKTSLKDKPENTIDVWYNPNNPSENEITDPCKEYNEVKDSKEGKYLWIFQIVGILAALLVIYNVFSLIKNIIMLGAETAGKKFSKKK